MFSKKYEYHSDDPGIQENMERIRQRMVANIMPTHASLRTTEASVEQDLDRRGPPALITLEWQKYDSADQSLATAISACQQVAEKNREADLRQGAWASLSRAMRRPFHWYTKPSERYWEALTTGLNHVVASLKAHEAVLHIHADAIRGSQQKYSDLADRLRENRRQMLATPSSSQLADDGTPGNAMARTLRVDLNP